MNTDSMIQVQNVVKKFKGFELNIPQLNIPKGFATALIGENGAGKSTLMNILAGVRLDYKGEIIYFDGSMKDEEVRENIGYTSPNSYFMPQWTIKAVGEVSKLLFDNFHKDRYVQLCEDLNINKEDKTIANLSDGMRMKTALAAVFARDTKCLLLDEPASPLDPLMRDKLCSMLREYLDEGNGEKSVFFSTHNIADMENVTDYCVIMEQGKVVEQGFVEDLKEKYIMVKGELADEAKAKDILIGFRKNSYGYEGLCLAENLDKLAGLDIAVETPTLSQISVAVMKQYSSLKA
ncbi:MAG: ABC transporter ATP-binding protein [Lachnospiraceae bacterium]|nr:ABC transporter ATP-binding protein [Lachnospiraceae bacterium]